MQKFLVLNKKDISNLIITEYLTTLNLDSLNFRIVKENNTNLELTPESKDLDKWLYLNNYSNKLSEIYMKTNQDPLTIYYENI